MSIRRLLAATALTLGALALVAGRQTPAPGGPAEISALELARALRADSGSLLLLDIRPATAYQEFHLPRAVHLPLATAEETSPAETIEVWMEAFAALESSSDNRLILAGGPETPTRALWLALRGRDRAAAYLPDAVGSWLETIVSPIHSPTEDPSVQARWAEQAELSRYFGGFPRVVRAIEGATRSGAARGGPSSSTAERLAHARRRGCAF